MPSGRRSTFRWRQSVLCSSATGSEYQKDVLGVSTSGARGTCAIRVRDEGVDRLCNVLIGRAQELLHLPVRKNNLGQSQRTSRERERERERHARTLKELPASVPLAS